MFFRAPARQIVEQISLPWRILDGESNKELMTVLEIETNGPYCFATWMNDRHLLPARLLLDVSDSACSLRVKLTVNAEGNPAFVCIDRETGMAVCGLEGQVLVDDLAQLGLFSSSLQALICAYCQHDLKGDRDLLAHVSEEVVLQLDDVDGTIIDDQTPEMVQDGDDPYIYKSDCEGAVSSDNAEEDLNNRTIHAIKSVDQGHADNLDAGPAKPTSQKDVEQEAPTLVDKGIAQEFQNYQEQVAQSMCDASHSNLLDPHFNLAQEITTSPKVKRFRYVTDA